MDGSCKKEKKNMVAGVDRPVRNVVQMVRREADLHETAILCIFT